MLFILPLFSTDSKTWGLISIQHNFIKFEVDNIYDFLFSLTLVPAYTDLLILFPLPRPLKFLFFIGLGENRHGTLLLILW